MSIVCHGWITNSLTSHSYAFDAIKCHTAANMAIDWLSCGNQISGSGSVKLLKAYLKPRRQTG